LTRLTSLDIRNIPQTMKRYDLELREKTGCGLLEIAKDACRAEKNITGILRKTRAAVIPVTAGKGVVPGFCEAVAAILEYTGMKTFVTRGTDIAGIAEACELGADVIFAADDDKFVAINLATKRVVDNAVATGKAYVAALDRMAKGLEGKEVLLIGVGNVGLAAAKDLIRRRARVLAVDTNRRRLANLKKRHGNRVRVFYTVSKALPHANLIVDAAPARNIIKLNMINGDTKIATPAVPLGLTKAALDRVGGRNLVHDALQLGVATMAVEACTVRNN